MLDLREALGYVVRKEGSDLHLKVSSRPLARIHGRLEPIAEYEPLQPQDTERMLREMLVEHPDKLIEFEREHEADFAFAIEGLARFRVNAFRQRSGISIAARVIPCAVRTVAELGLPAVINELADEERGLILLTGTTGSGKSTTLAAIIDHINETKSRHVVTMEDPIEYLHSDRNSIINQREVGMDRASFTRAMRRVLRQDPDVILIGEMRDEETVRSALSAAETGHPVLSTVHRARRAGDGQQDHRLLPPARAEPGSSDAGWNAARRRLAATRAHPGRRRPGRGVRGPPDDGPRSGPDPGSRRDRALARGLAEDEYYGMQTFDQTLLRQHQAGRVSMKDALRVATSPHDFKLLVAAEGRTSTSMDAMAAPAVKVGPVTVKRTGPPVAPRVPTRSGSSPPPGVAA